MKDTYEKEQDNHGPKIQLPLFPEEESVTGHWIQDFWPLVPYDLSRSDLAVWVYYLRYAGSLSRGVRPFVDTLD